MVKENIMDRKYGKQEIPKSVKAGPKEEKYWGWIQTIIADENFTLKRIFNEGRSGAAWNIILRMKTIL